MSSYENWVFPLLRRLDAETAHDRTLSALVMAQQSAAGRAVLRRIGGPLPVQPVECAGLTFPNVLGLAAGFDKECRAVEGLGLLGFGHIEVGTLTPGPQEGNPRPRVFRLSEDNALINRMGFPNAGVDAAVKGLRDLHGHPRNYVLGVSLGKQKETELGKAIEDYLGVMGVVFPYCDYLAVNISSPNTPGLRELQGPRYLVELLNRLKAVANELASRHNINQRPIFVKISPDLSWPELDEILDAVTSTGTDGIIATNTTLQRNGLKGASREESGGLSGAPLCERSTAIIAYINKQTSAKVPVIGVGGISSAADICAKLEAGATLVQLYTGLIYQGPGLPGRLLRDLDRTRCA